MPFLFAGFAQRLRSSSKPSTGETPAQAFVVRRDATNFGRSHLPLWTASALLLLLTALTPGTLEASPPPMSNRSVPLSATAPCVAGSAILCLNSQRFKLEVRWKDFQGNTGAGQAIPLTSDTGYFWFFSSNNVELVVKVLDARAFNGRFWVFYGALSNVEYTLTVTDTATGRVKSYTNPSGSFGSVGDTDAFSASTARPAASRTGQPRETPRLGGMFEFPADLSGTARAEAPCPVEPTRLYLSGCRFRVSVSWKDFQGNTGVGQAVTLTSDTGYFWFFSANNVELVVKALDGRALNGNFWVFYGALSNVQYTMTVTDTETGIVKTYSNPSGVFASVGDTEAFGKPTTSMVISGVVSQEQSGLPPTPSGGVEVKMTSNLNPAGVSVQTDPTGHYSLAMNVTLGEQVVLVARAATMAPAFQVIQAGPNAHLDFNLLLRSLNPLACAGSSCSTSDKRVSIAGLPAGVAGSARAFNPVTERNAFPGPFVDSTGKLLTSGVFAEVQLQDQSGLRVTQLSAPATLRMRIPTETWSTTQDIHPGTGKIEVPLYAFDEVKGQWVLESEGVLETDAGAVLPESELAAVRNGTHQGGLFVAGPVTHFSSWNMDFATSKRQCVTILITNEKGEPLEGAAVRSEGVTYVGGSAWKTVGQDGKVCEKVLPSELPGEDLNGNGISGEQHKTHFLVKYKGEIYDGGTVTAPTQTSLTADCTGCIDLRISLTQTLPVEVCTVQGVVVDDLNTPVAGAIVVGFDETVPEERYAQLCGPSSSDCTSSATSDGAGLFRLKFPILSSMPVDVIGFKLTPTSVLIGSQTLAGCPSAGTVVTLKLTELGLNAD